MEIRPITLRDANKFVTQFHRHSKAVVGCKFAIALYENDEIRGCAICGRPVSRELDDGLTLEINRVCTDGIKNGCSMLYGASCKVAKAMGYKKVITYTLESESGASLKVANFEYEGVAGCTRWRGKRNSGQNVPQEMKKRWAKAI